MVVVFVALQGASAHPIQSDSAQAALQEAEIRFPDAGPLAWSDSVHTWTEVYSDGTEMVVREAGELVVSEAAEAPEQESTQPEGDAAIQSPVLIAPSLLEHASMRTPVEMVEIEVALNRRAWMPERATFWRRWRAHLGDNPAIENSRDERAAYRRLWHEEMQTLAQESMDRARLDMAELGGEVLHDNLLSGTMVARIPAGSVTALSDIAGLSRADLRDLEPEDDGAGVWYAVSGAGLDGKELEDLYQTRHFNDDGYDGDGFTLAVVEGNGERIHRSHFGFGGRVDNCQWVWPFGCNNINPTNQSSDGSHSTAVASILLGSIMDGEDTTYAPGTPRRQRSGLATGAAGVGFGTSNESFVADKILDLDIELSNHSWGSSSDDPACTGQTAKAQRWNSLFEAGHVVVTSSGNEGHGNTNDCTTKNPGTGIGVLTVGAYEVQGSSSASSFTRKYGSTSRGGTSTEGGGRSIVDLAGAARLEYPYPHYQWPIDSGGNLYYYGADWPNATPNPQRFCCTSAATPGVAGALTVYRDWFEAKVGSSVSDPGNLMAQALLMGDAAKSDGTGYRMSGWDRLWGAGKLRLRKFDEPGGLGAPYKWSTGKVCVANQQSTYVDIHSSLPAGVDVVKAVSFFYDYNHDTGGTLDDVDLTLQYRIAGSSIWWNAAQNTSGDNKKRAIVDGPTTGVQWRLRLHGTNVPSAGAIPGGCNGSSNYVMVDYAYMFESSTRPLGSPYRTEFWIE